MAKGRPQRRLDLAKTLYIWPRFGTVFNGRTFALGGVFPWRELGVSERLMVRRVRQFFRQRRIGHEPVVVPPAKAAPAAVRVDFAPKRSKRKPQPSATE